MVELGQFALRLALPVALIACAAGIMAGLWRRAAWAQVARRAVLLTFALCTVALGALFWAFYTHDYSLHFVANHAARSMPTGYRLAALWGGQAGSLLLWCWMLCAYAAACITRKREHAALMPWVCACMAGNALFFLALLNLDLLKGAQWLANLGVEIDVHTHPFERLPPGVVLSDGAGLNPLLQHPVMLIHPLMLYTGMTGFAAPFAFAFAALASGNLGGAWMRTTRRLTLWAWLFLSIGILLGGRWAYEVLGWGGYWAWDPVENASLMPWLAGTAYLHSVMVQEKRDMLKIWNLALIGLTYALCLWGTMLTRSGLVRSVHAFAQTEIFGALFLGYVLLMAGGFALLLLWRVWRGNELRARNRIEAVVSREAGFLVNNWLFLALLAVVFTGTMWPKLTDWLTGVEQALGPAFFHLLGAPIGLLLLTLTGIGPLIAWRRATPANLRRQLALPAAAGALALAVALLWMNAAAGRTEWFAALTWAAAALVCATIVQEYARALRARMRRGETPAAALTMLFRKNQRRYGGYVVHLGVVFLFVGFAGAAFNVERLETLAPGDAAHIGGYRLEYRTARALPNQHYGGAEARIALYEAAEGGGRGAPLAIMRPERRMYWLEEQPVSIPAIWSTAREDLYLVLTAIESDGAATLKLYINPLVNWIWLGGLVFVFGAALVMWPQRQGQT